MKPGDLLASKYRLERVLGVGGMGQVWAAVNEGTGRPFAIKLMHALPPEFRVRLLREARAGGTLAHKNIVDIYDIGETETGDPFLVMELLTGETLAERLRRDGPMRPSRAVDVAISVASALRAAHAKGIVHRDLKPANVFLQRDPEGEGETVKVLDFGASKYLEEASATVTGSLVGSPAYMSPEQARAEADIDGRSDLWSLGVLLFEMLSGQRPFRAPTTYAVISEVIHGPIPRVTDLVGGLDPAIVDVVDRCLVRPVGARIGSADEVIRLLRAQRGDVGESSNPAPAPRRDPPPTASDHAVARSLPTTTASLPTTPRALPAPTPSAPGVAASAPASAGASGSLHAAPLAFEAGGAPPAGGAERSGHGRSPTRGQAVAIVAGGACAAALLALGVLAAASRRPPHADPAAAVATSAPREATTALAAPARAEPDPPAPTAAPVASVEAPAPAAAASSAVAPRPLGRGEAMIVVDAPDGTSVSVDGEDVGATPLAPIVVPAGAHRVTFKHPTLGERVARVEVQAGETNLAATQFGKETKPAGTRAHAGGEKRLVLP